MPSSVCWFLEFQDRGAPHFHLLCTGYMPHQAVATAWVRATGGLADLNAATNVVGVQEGHGAYALKAYGPKVKQKVVPDGFTHVGRFWGVWGVSDMKPVVATTVDVADAVVDLRYKVASDSLRRRGYDVYDMPFNGLIAFPGGKK